MIKATDAYKAAIVGDSRRIFLRAAIDIIDPDITYEENTAENAAAFSKLDQLSNKENALTRDYTTLEANRWILGDESIAIPDDPTGTKHIEIDCHFIRQHIVRNALRLISIGTLDQPADLFTKAHHPGRFRNLVSKLKLVSLSPT